MIFLKPIWLFLNDEIVGIILFKNNNSIFAKNSQYQIRGSHFNRTSKKGIGEEWVSCRRLYQNNIAII
jgi:hypothetical protein